MVQNAHTGAVLMLGYVSAESLALTQATGLVTFWSRSRQQLWTKGETSGNTLRVVSLHPDCDRDTLLIRAEPTGPTCHRGTETCFDDVPPPAPVPASAFLDELERLIGERAEAADVITSYTARLLARPEKAAQKVGEEAVEVVIESLRADRPRLIEETADLLYHLLVLLRTQHVRLDDVATVLRARHQTGTTGA